jgi:hypothetical protein
MKISGVLVTIKSQDEHSAFKKLGSPFPCSNCGEKMVFDVADVKDVKRFPEVAAYAEIARALNNLYRGMHAKKMDFIDFYSKLFKIHAKRNAIERDFTLNSGYVTTFDVKCNNCGRVERFEVTVESSAEIPDELDILAVYRTLKINDNKRFNKLMSRYCEKVGWRDGLDKPEDILARLSGLDKNTSSIREIVGSLNAVLDSVNPPSEDVAMWAKDLKSSLTELESRFRRNAEKEMRSLLTTITEQLRNV